MPRHTECGRDPLRDIVAVFFCALNLKNGRFKLSAGLQVTHEFGIVEQPAKATAARPTPSKGASDWSFNRVNV